MTKRTWPLLLLVCLLAACQSDPATPPAVTSTPGEVALSGEDATVAAPSDGGDTPAEATTVPEPTAQPTVTPTPVPPKELIVCMATEPESLYLYSDHSAAAVAVRHALYEAPYTELDFVYQPLALTDLPTLDNGGAVLEDVEVRAGDIVMTADRQVGVLGPGIPVITSDGERVVFDEEPLRMPRLSVDYTFQPLVWSDGTPVTAADSVFSYEMATDLNTPAIDRLADLTQSYEAVDDATVRWTGLPGFIDPAYMTHVWTPLPRHQLGEFGAAELLTAVETTQAPLSYGPFQVDGWTPGEEIRLVPNPYYYRADEGLPHVDMLTIRFVGSAADALPAAFAACDVITQDVVTAADLPNLLAAESEGLITAHVTESPVVEYLLYGINPTIGYAQSRPDWFEDARVRQAIALCSDRQRLVDELTGGRSEVIHTYVLPAHAFHPEDVTQWPYDPAAGNALLDEIGYVDNNGDGIREDIGATTPFSVTLATNSESDVRLQIIDQLAADLAACGLQVAVTPIPAGSWFAPGPQGPVFGRRFDLAEFAWLGRNEPNCGLFLSDNTPGPVDEGFGGWSNVNVTGWAFEPFDAACREALGLLPGQPGYVEAHQEALRLFAQELPGLPLFARLRVAATQPDVINFRLNASQPSEFWNVGEWDVPAP